VPGLSDVKHLYRCCIVSIVEPGLLRIGELSRRTGVTPELLRAWERRYGLLQPDRSEGGLRLYTPEDLERVLRMQQHLSAGIAAAEAAALAAAGGSETDGVAFDAVATRRDLGAALEAFDEPSAQAVLDSLFARAGLDALLAEVLLPYLHELGERWERGEISVAQEHFASSVLRGRMLGLARGWGRGFGPRVLLTCLPDERHDFGLIAFGLVLHDRGFRIAYLGDDTPIDSIASAADAVGPAWVVVSAVDPQRYRELRSELRALARTHPVCIGGPGATEDEAKAIEATYLSGGAVEEAERLAALVA
jgi:MerR family transcriptional regulator, light-induced transcriptional regulator